MYNELLQDSYLTRNVSHLSGIITPGNLKLNIDWHSVTVCISLVLNNFFPTKRSGVRSSVCPTYRPLQQRAAGLLLWARRAGDSDRKWRPPDAAAATAVSSKCEQCHVYSRRRKLDADVLEMIALVGHIRLPIIIIIIDICKVA